MGETKIEWTATARADGSLAPGYTFNPWTGCTKVSLACDNCYAESWAKRSGLVEWGNHPRRRTSADYWRQPVKWNKRAATEGIRRKVFCASLADVFDNQAPIEWLVDLLDMVFDTPHLDWLLLTKRPQNIRKRLSEAAESGRGVISGAIWQWLQGDSPPNNVWLGTTVENNDEVDRRIPALLEVLAKIHFLSCEPLLGPLDLNNIKYRSGMNGWLSAFNDGAWPKLGRIDWIIGGGESGSHARPTNPDWMRSLRDQCHAAGVPFFFKQWGEWAPPPFDEDSAENLRLRSGDRAFVFDDMVQMARIGKKASGALLDGREWREMPQ